MPGMRLVKVSLGGGTTVRYSYYFGDIDKEEYVRFLAWTRHERTELAMKLQVNAFQVGLEITAYKIEEVMAMHMEDFPDVPMKLMMQVLLYSID